MTSEDRERLRAQLIRHEGLRLRMYLDSVGKWTIGIGRNLDDRGISHVEALFLLDNDIELCEAQLTQRYRWFSALDPIRQRVVVDMCFNLGIQRLAAFTRMVACMERGDYQLAAAEMMDSKWASQVGNRARRLSAMMRTGNEPR